MVRKKINRVLVLVSKDKHDAALIAEELKEILHRYQVEVIWLDQEYVMSDGVMGGSLGDLSKTKTDMIIAVGGDGTLLRAARRAHGSKAPLLGINAGTLGFLTSLPGAHVEHALPRILNGEYLIVERMALAIRVFRGEELLYKGWALNEGVVARNDHSHIVRLEVSVSGEYLTDYLCDGLIISTPTGSTAYSLSAGGPIISPQARGIILNPLCAHTLTNRPLIVDYDNIITVHVPAKNAPVALETDGVSCAMLEPGDHVEFSRAAHPSRLAVLPEYSFYSVLRQKLRWSGGNI